jgi:hypothetical protein
MRQQDANQKMAIRDAEAASKIQSQGIRIWHNDNYSRWMPTRYLNWKNY